MAARLSTTPTVATAADDQATSDEAPPRRGILPGGASAAGEGAAERVEERLAGAAGLLLQPRDQLRPTVEGLLKTVAPDGRIHTTFNQLIAATGRLSSTDPNLQNIPVRTEEGRRIREAFVVGPGHESLMTADYSQIEMRIMAHLSEDALLIEAFRSGRDFHSITAARVFDVPADDVGLAGKGLRCNGFSPCRGNSLTPVTGSTRCAIRSVRVAAVAASSSATSPERSAAPDPAIKALGHWVHVEIDAATRRPTPIPDHLRALMEAAVVEVPEVSR
mgnify:CR=1 FL=1